MRNKREHFGACKVNAMWPYPTMVGAYSALDPFQVAVYCPLHMVRMRLKAGGF